MKKLFVLLLIVPLFSSCLESDDDGSIKLTDSRWISDEDSAESYTTKYTLDFASPTVCTLKIKAEKDADDSEISPIKYNYVYDHPNIKKADGNILAIVKSKKLLLHYEGSTITLKRDK